jgi:Flp pilus assembly pilin Flp
MKQLLKTLWKDESAQGATEYILMLVIVVGIAMLFKNQIMGIIKGKVSELGDSIQSFNSSGN